MIDVSINSVVTRENSEMVELDLGPPAKEFPPYYNWAHQEIFQGFSIDVVQMDDEEIFDRNEINELPLNCNEKIDGGLQRKKAIRWELFSTKVSSKDSESHNYESKIASTSMNEVMLEDVELAKSPVIERTENEIEKSMLSQMVQNVRAAFPKEEKKDQAACCCIIQ